MASITKEIRSGKTVYRVEWRDKDGRRHKIRLGAIALHDAESIKSKVQSIVSAQAVGNDLPLAVSVWLNELGDSLYEKLADQGLVKPRPKLLLSEWLDHYINSKKNQVKESTLLAIERSKEILQERLGAVQLKAITESQCHEFRTYLSSRYAQPTVAKIIKHCKQFFNKAVSDCQISTNPFQNVLAGTQVNEERSEYVSVETIQKAIQSAPDSQWRLIIALCRYAGLRCKSEVLALRWSDVDFVAGELTIRSSKTERQGKATRKMPILPALRPYLEDAFDPESDRVITRYRESNANLRKMFLQILEKAKIEPWPRLFHNLRGSLETDLLENFAIHNVTKWMGHSEKTALKHYVKVSPKAAEAARAFDIVGGVGQHWGPKAAETASTEGNKPKAVTQKTSESTNRRVSRSNQIGRAGLEPATKGL